MSKGIFINTDKSNQIKNAINIIEVIGDFITIKKQGVVYICNCPFHDEDTDSFAIYEGSGTYKCFGCGASGDAIEFLIKYPSNNIANYNEALVWLANKYNIDIENNKPLSKSAVARINNNTKKRKKMKKQADEKAKKEKANKLKYLIDKAIGTNKREATKYLSGKKKQERGLQTDTYPEEAYNYLKPYTNKKTGSQVSGSVVFFDRDRKYLNRRYINPAEGQITKSGFGTLTNAVYDIAFIPDHEDVYVAEAAINALSIKDAGKSAIATFSTNNRISDIEKFARYFSDRNVILAYDFDKNYSGQKAAILLLFFIKQNFRIKSGGILIFPTNKDANVLQKEDKLFDYLNNKENYVYPKIDELKEHIIKIKKDYKKYKPQIRPEQSMRPAKEDEKDGAFTMQQEKIPDDIFDKLNVSGLLDKQVLASIDFLYIKEYTIVADGFVYKHRSTVENPIFVIDDKVVIRPFAKSPQKKVIFYNKEEEYEWTFGLEYLKENHNLINESEEEMEGSKSKRKNKVQKIPRVIVVYNFIDFLSLLSASEIPIFINDYFVSKFKNTVLSYAHQIYQTPTNNRIELKRAKENAVKHIEIHSYYLEKDIYSVSHFIKEQGQFLFKKHLNTALPLKFWEWDRYKRDFDINIIVFRNFLNELGYFTYEMITNEKDYIYIKIKGKVVEKMGKDIFPRYIKTKVDKYLEDRGEIIKLRNKIAISTRFSENNLSGLKQKELDFNNSGPDFQNFFFTDGMMWKVTKDGIEVKSQKEIKKYIWKDELLDIPSDKQDAPFTIFRQRNYSKTLSKLTEAKKANDIRKLKEAKKELLKYRDIDKWDIKINDRNNYYLQYLFATSYKHWRRAETNGYFLKPSDFWYKMPKDLFTTDELNEMKLHFINKITHLGYFIKGHREPTDGYGAAILDAIDSDGASGGGKTLMAKAFEQFMPVLRLKADQEDFFKDKHRYQLYNNERLIIFEDVDKSADPKDLVTDFSEGINKNRKHKDIIPIPFSKSPKILLTANSFTPLIKRSERIDRRIGLLYVYDFFHTARSGKFKTERTPADWFGRMLYTSDTDKQKNDLINCFAYMFIAREHYKEINAPMENAKKLKLENEIGDPLIDFLDDFFIGNENFGYLDRSPFFELFHNTQYNKMSYKERTKIYNTPRKFKPLVEAYCKMRGYIFNPKELLNKDNKRIYYPSVYQKTVSGKPKKTEHFWINTEAETNEEIKRKNTIKLKVKKVVKKVSFKEKINEFDVFSDIELTEEFK